MSNPIDHKSADLALLQALIIELGFFNPPNGADCTSDSGCPTPSFDLSDVPQSVRAAKSFIRSRVFLDVRDYLALRSGSPPERVAPFEEVTRHRTEEEGCENPMGLGQTKGAQHPPRHMFLNRLSNDVPSPLLVYPFTQTTLTVDGPKKR